MEKLNSKTSNLNGKQQKLADKMISDHIIEPPYPKLPPYEYHSLEKGLTCAICNSFFISCDDRKAKCDQCGFVEEVESAVVRSVGEFKLLFPNLKITTNIIHDWCRVVESRKTIRKFLKKNFKTVGYGQWAFYE
ncbi:hypothetical protein [Bacillus sp. OK048]|uniref:hypothetical protein n=1 Tax=Bacillus sp. OK048 TaxID=1882761 RepID=UPI000B811AE3|nr:hypothetical protein [Bacillus sp. OK048]